MWKIIALLLLMFGFVWVYMNQDSLFQRAENYLKNEKTISRVNGASAAKEDAIMDAQRKALEY